MRVLLCWAVAPALQTYACVVLLLLLLLPCRAQVQWKFVNRAIDEVENGNVPAVVLICRCVQASAASPPILRAIIAVCWFAVTVQSPIQLDLAENEHMTTLPASTALLAHIALVSQVR